MAIKSVNPNDVPKADQIAPSVSYDEVKLAIYSAIEIRR